MKNPSMKKLIQLLQDYTGNMILAGSDADEVHKISGVILNFIDYVWSQQSDAEWRKDVK